MAEDNDKTPEGWQVMTYFKRADLHEDSPICSGRMDAETPEEAFSAWPYWIDGIDLSNQQLEADPGLGMSALLIPTVDKVNDQVDPTKILGYFCECHEMKVYPPAWIMDELYQRFDKYIRDNERGENRRLGEYFGEKTESSPKPKFREYVMKEPMDIACANVHRLITWFDLTQTAALDIIVMQLDDAPDRHPDWATKRPKGREALRKAYQRWKDAFEGISSIFDGHTAKEFNEYWPDPTNEQRVQFLGAIGEERLTGHPHLLAWLKK